VVVRSELGDLLGGEAGEAELLTPSRRLISGRSKEAEEKEERDAPFQSDS
jgi:hypothetical protein